MYKIFWLAAVIFVLAGCGGRRGISLLRESRAVQSTEATQTDAPTPSPPSPTPTPPATAIVEWPPPLRRLFSVAGVITGINGTISEDGTIPWDTEWLEIYIEKPDGTSAVIVGVHATAFIFGSKPQIGMHVTAYVLYDYPIFVNVLSRGLPIYIASAIIAGFPAEQGIIVCCDFPDDETFSFIVNNTTELYNEVQRRGWRNWANMGWVSWVFAPRSNADTLLLAESLIRRNPLDDISNRVIAVLYDSTYDGLPIADKVISFHDWSPLHIRVWDEENPPPREITLGFTDYIFPADAFETAALPIFINGEEVTSAPPIFAADGTTILVPFREAMDASVSVGIGAWLTNDGDLNLFGGGGGSEDSHWQIGRASVGYIGSRFTPIFSQPIIVGGIVYVPLSAMKFNAPFAHAWLFDDRIEFYSEGFPYGMWIEKFREGGDYTLSDEELASFEIIINGTAIANHHAIFDPDAFHRDTILIPLAAVAEGLGHNIVQCEYGWLFLENEQGQRSSGSQRIVNDEVYNLLHDLPWLLCAIIYDGQILLQSR